MPVVSYLVLQACILFVALQTRVAHFCFSIVRIHIHQKDPCVRKFFVRYSGAGNGCVYFMDAWKNAFFLQEKPCP